VLLDRCSVEHDVKATVPIMAIYALGSVVPTLHPEAWVHPDATIIGNVTVGAGSTIWPQAVLRGDYGFIRIGARTSIQDGTVIHCTAELPTIIGDDCVVGHLAHLECCTVEDGALVGTNSVVLHRAVIRTNSLVGASALVPNDMEVPSGAMALGVPARLRLGVVTPNMIRPNAANYVRNGERYRAELRRVDAPDAG
jgi:carbonic anhydrase/acetyltransferase-like protein (isoleucine patch superfamily)